MSLFPTLLILALLVGLSFLHLPMLLWVIIWPAAVYLFLTWAVAVPIPASVVGIYMGLTLLGVAAYVLADQDRYEQVRKQITAFLVEKKYNYWLKAVIAFMPIVVAGKIYLDLNVEIRAPTFGRTVHPAPPGETDFKGKKIDLIRGKNPLRELKKSNPQKFAEHVANGKRVYYQNCVFCHGDDLRGDGLFAHGFNPVPANLNSATTIGMLQEGYLFWRIAKGGPGLPGESAPWSSSMPAWEKFLEEQEIWEVILYLYDHTGLKPREEEEHHE